MSRITTKKEAYTFDYPEAIQFAEQQQSIFWTANEIDVEKDVQDIYVNMTEAERHGVITTLKLFTLYELVAGNEYWSGRVSKEFPRPDIQRMASCFSFFELNVHAPFYAKLNEALGLDTDEFYTDYVKDQDLKKRMDFIDKIVNQSYLTASVGVFSLVEGVILYSSFAFLKHFQTQGKNKLNNVVAGINFSLNDENIHSTAGAWLYKTLCEEEGVDFKDDVIIEAAKTIYEHECLIIDKIFEKGTIKGITEHQLKCFVQSRINLCLRNLGMENIYEVRYNPIQEWFYKNANAVKLHDFFSRTGNAYNRNWTESKFIW